jgi:KDO2-lipid IV(A) lauroyltransferase
MAKKISRKIEYAALVIFAAAIRKLSIEKARVVAGVLGAFAWNVIKIRRKVVVANLAAAFPEKSSEEIAALGLATYRQVATTMIELLFFPRLSTAQLLEMVKFNNLDLVEIALKQGRGAVMVGAHFGNWELMGAALAQRLPVSFVVGAQENAPVDDMLNSYRAGKGVKLIPLKLALRGVMKTLKANELVAILADQDAHENGAFVKFMGRTASTPKGPASFAMRARCPLIMGNIMRGTDGKFTVNFDVVPKPEPSGNEATDIINYTANFNKLLEGYVRLYPDHWFWMHRRWKTKEPLCVKPS